MGLLFLGFPWSVLSVIGLPGTAFPEKLIERVFKQQYQPSNCFAWCCCDLQNDQRRQQEKQKAQFFFSEPVSARRFGNSGWNTAEKWCWWFPLDQGTWMPRFGFPLECVCPALSSAGKNGFRANSCRKFRNGEEGSNGTEVKTNEGKRERRQHWWDIHG